MSAIAAGLSRSLGQLATVDDGLHFHHHGIEQPVDRVDSQLGVIGQDGVGQLAVEGEGI